MLPSTLQHFSNVVLLLIEPVIKFVRFENCFLNKIQIKNRKWAYLFQLSGWFSTVEKVISVFVSAILDGMAWMIFFRHLTI